jgi:hypothetical protein
MDNRLSLVHFPDRPEKTHRVLTVCSLTLSACNTVKGSAGH